MPAGTERRGEDHHGQDGVHAAGARRRDGHSMRRRRGRPARAGQTPPLAGARRGTGVLPAGKRDRQPAILRADRRGPAPRAGTPDRRRPGTGLADGPARRARRDVLARHAAAPAHREGRGRLVPPAAAGRADHGTGRGERPADPPDRGGAASAGQGRPADDPRDAGGGVPRRPRRRHFVRDRCRVRDRPRAGRQGPHRRRVLVHCPAGLARRRRRPGAVARMRPQRRDGRAQRGLHDRRRMVRR